MKICIPIREKSLKKAKQQVKKAAPYADFLEIWLDRDLQITNYKLQIGKVPVIAVCRGKEEKGDFRGIEQERVEILESAIKGGAKFVDVGIYTAPKSIKDLKAVCRQHHTKLIISVHIYKNTPDIEKLEKMALKAKKLGADIVKIATFAKRWEDNVTLFELTKRLHGRGLECIIVGMGERGKISRIGCPLLGSFLAYVALDKKSKTAPGQMTLKELSFKL